MSFQQIPGKGLVFPSNTQLAGAPALDSGLVIAATGAKLAMIGRVWFPARTGTKDIRRICLRWGVITKAGGSAMTISLQDVNLSAGPPGQPDGTQDQTVAVANGDSGFVSNTWYRSGTLSADRTVTYGDRLAVVVEYNGSGRLGADTVTVNAFVTQAAVLAFLPCATSLNTGSWASTASALPIVALEFSDGTFGTLDGAFPMSAAANTHTIAVNTSVADEYAITLAFPFPCKVDGLWAFVRPAASADYELNLYDGTTALATVTVDNHAGLAATTRRVALEPITEQTLLANHTYRVSVRPTTTNTVDVFSYDVADANHLTLHDGGISCTFDTRLDQGAWIGAVATRRFIAGVRISQLDDGAGGMILSRVRSGF